MTTKQSFSVHKYEHVEDGFHASFTVDIHTNP